MIYIYIYIYIYSPDKRYVSKMSCLEHPCGRQSTIAVLEDTPGHVLDVDSEQKSGLTGEQTTFLFLAAQGNGKQHAHLVHLAVSSKCLDYWCVCVCVCVCVEGLGDGICSQGPFMNTLDVPEQCDQRLVQDSLLSMTCTTTPPEVVFCWLYPIPQDSEVLAAVRTLCTHIRRS